MTNNQYGNYQTPSSRPPEPPYRAGQAGSQGASASTDGYAGNTSAGAPFGNAQADLRGFDTSPIGGTEQGAASDGTTGRMSSSYSYEAPRASHQAAPKQRTAGAGKTFLFGFLGALLACGVALGGYTAFTSSTNASTTAATTLGTSDSSVINAVEEGQTLSEAVAAKALPSVVAIYNYQEQSSYGYGYGYGNQGSTGDLTAAGMGSGVLISDDGYILTNYHVVEDAAKLTVKVGDEERDAEFVGGDDSSDVAVVKLDNTEGLVAADIGDSDNLVIGEWVMTVGAPLGLEQSVATGVVSATNRSTIMSDSSSNGYGYYTNATPEYTYYPNMIQTDAVINPGNSGGALVDADGKLIGINTMISSYSGDYAGVGFAIPVNYAMGIAEDIIAGKEPTHAALGVTISSVNSSIAQRYGLSTDSGAYISGVAEVSGAAEAGLQVGDIITAIDGKQVSSTTEVTLDVREHQPGDTVTVTVNRNGQSQDVQVVLSSDEDVNFPTTSNGQDNANPYGQGQGQGQGDSNGGGTYGYDMEELEELLKMLGM